MDFNVEPLAACRKKIGVVVPPERIQEEYEKKFDEINEHVALPGFRPGRAPRALLERRFGTKLADEIKGDLVKAALEKLVEDKHVEPLRPPEIDVDTIEMSRGEAMSFEFELVTRPEFDTPEYKGLEAKVPPVEVSDAEIDEAVDGLRRRSATLEDAPEDATISAEDILTVNWKAQDGDSIVAQDNGAWYPYGREVLAGFHAEGLDAQIEGQGPGATAEVSVQVAADDHREELRGKELTLAVEVKGIKRYVLPEIDEDFLKRNDYDDVDELRDEMKKSIQRAKRRAHERQAEGDLVAQLVEGIEMSLPDDFIQEEMETWATRRRLELQMEEVEDDEIAKQIDAGRKDAEAHITQDLTRFFLLERIADAEDVNVTEAEMVQAIQEIAQAYGHPVEAVMGSFREPGRVAELRSQIRHRKVRALIREAATLVEDAALLKDADDDAKPAAKKKAAKKKAAKKKAAKKD